MGAAGLHRYRHLLGLVGLMASVALNVGLANAEVGDIQAGARIGPAVRLRRGSTAAEYLVLQRLGYTLSREFEVAVAFGFGGDLQRVPQSVLSFTLDRTFALAATSRVFAGVNVGARSRLIQKDPEIREAIGGQLGVQVDLSRHWFVLMEARYDAPVTSFDHGVIAVLFGVSYRAALRSS